MDTISSRKMSSNLFREDVFQGHLLNLNQHIGTKIMLLTALFYRLLFGNFHSHISFSSSR